MAPIRTSAAVARAQSLETNRPPPRNSTFHVLRAMPDTLPTLEDYLAIETQYKASLPPNIRSKALIDVTLFHSIWNVLNDPQDDSPYTAQFINWAKATFDVRPSSSSPPILYHGDRPVAVRDKIYEILCVAHLRAAHGSRDQTDALVRESWSCVPKDLIERFIRACPTCEEQRKRLAEEQRRAAQPPPANPNFQRPIVQGWDGPEETLPDDQLHLFEVARSVLNARFDPPGLFPPIQYVANPRPPQPEVAAPDNATPDTRRTASASSNSSGSSNDDLSGRRVSPSGLFGLTSRGGSGRRISSLTSTNGSLLSVPSPSITSQDQVGDSDIDPALFDASPIIVSLTTILCATCH